MTRVQITLTEFSSTAIIKDGSEEAVRQTEITPLTPADRDTLLEKYAKEITVTPLAGSDEGEMKYCSLTPGSVIGTIRLKNVDIVIQPKIPISNVAFLISYSLDKQRFFDRNDEFDFLHSPTLTELIVASFAQRARHAMRMGLLHGYRVEEDALSTLRGRWRIDDQLRRHAGCIPPIEVRFDLFTEDIVENQILKAAVRRLRHMTIRSEKSRRTLVGLESALQTVSDVYFDSRRLPQVVFSRLNRHYEQAIELACLILRSISFDLGHGALASSSFLIDMNDVFENFVITALREELKLDTRRFPRNCVGHRFPYLDEGHRIALEPDISWWDGRYCRFVGDVKYKRLAEFGGIKHPDVYQMLAYCTASGLPSGMLIYAKGEENPIRHQLVNCGKEIEIIALDLSQPPRKILEQIAIIAIKIKQIYERHVPAAHTSP